MAEITASLVKELRERTGAGMMDCKKALAENAGSMEGAIEFLRKQGLKNVEKRAGKVAAEGSVFSYVHAGGRIGVMLEMNSETDFVARGDDFQELGKAIAMHIAWANPQFVKREEVDQKTIDKETEIIRESLKPGQEKVADKIIAGRLDKFFAEVCLEDQVDAKDASAKKSIGILVSEMGSRLGEKISIRRFSRYEVGEGIEKEVVDYAEEVRQAAQV